MLFTAKVENGGKTEGDAIRLLNAYRVTRTYDKDGLEQEAAEMLQTSFTKAINAMAAAIGNEKVGELWKSSNWKSYEFK